MRCGLGIGLAVGGGIGGDQGAPAWFDYPVNFPRWMGMAKGSNCRQGVENVAHGTETDHKETELGLSVQTLIFSQGAGSGRGWQLGKQTVQRLVCEVNLNGEADCFQGKVEGN